jgi:hypothetical protein
MDSMETDRVDTAILVLRMVVWLLFDAAFNSADVEAGPCALGKHQCMTISLCISSFPLLFS